VTDLVLNSDSPWGGGSPITSTKQTEQYYLEGLQSISSTVGATNIGTYMRAVNFDMLEGVKNLYFNSGWTFPFMDQDMGVAFINHVNGGNNLFVSGQDIGWDTWDENGNGTSASKAFYRNYLRADYVDDGGPANSSITPVAGDLVFGGVATSALTNPYGSNSQGTPNFYPDELSPRTDAVGTFVYPGDKIGAVRYASDKFKTAYFGFGMEMVEDKSIRDDIMKLTKEWFDGVISSVEYDAAIRGLSLQQNYPNPASAMTVIPFTASTRDLTLQVTDVTGRVLMTRSIPAGSTQLVLPTNTLQSGMYFYRVFDGVKVVGSKVMQVLR
jgi:hypothetical protein